MSLTQYPWNVEIDMAGVTFTGPGMDSKASAEAIARLAEDEESVNSVRVIQQ